MLRRKVGALIVRAFAAVASEFGRDEVYLGAGLLLIAYGCWDLWRPGSFLAPGGVLLWIALPCRSPFIERATADAKKG